jgi:hypothetical protein
VIDEHRPIWWVICSHESSAEARRNMWNNCLAVQRLAICYEPPEDDRSEEWLRVVRNRFANIPEGALVIVRGRGEILGACLLGDYDRVDPFPDPRHPHYRNTRIIRRSINLDIPFPVGRLPHTLPRTNVSMMANYGEAQQNVATVFGSPNPL